MKVWICDCGRTKQSEDFFEKMTCSHCQGEMSLAKDLDTIINCVRCFSIINLIVKKQDKFYTCPSCKYCCGNPKYAKEIR